MGWPTAGPSVAGFTPGELVDGGDCAIASTSVERITRDMHQRDLGFVARPGMLVPERDRPPVFFHKRRSGQRAAACRGSHHVKEMVRGAGSPGQSLVTGHGRSR